MRDFIVDFIVHHGGMDAIKANVQDSPTSSPLSTRLHPDPPPLEHVAPVLESKINNPDEAAPDQRSALLNDILAGNILKVPKLK